MLLEVAALLSLSYILFRLLFKNVEPRPLSSAGAVKTMIVLGSGVQQYRRSSRSSSLLNVDSLPSHMSAQEVILLRC
jgi:hypothetical protein